MSKAELKLNNFEDVELEEVNWLWYPYIPLGKLTIIQGDPAQGKTHLLLKLAADCTNGTPFPECEANEPFNVIYQTAEDGLGDTIKPRLIKSGADQSRIFNIDEDEQPVTVLDERVEQAIIQTQAKLVIFDPIQAYLGAKVDINNAVDVRRVLGQLGRLATKHGCAIVLIGHLNKKETVNSSSRGMGSMDIRACARSVLLLGRHKDDPDVRVIVHDKSSLAPEGSSIAFKLHQEEGFQWIDGYEDVTAVDLLSVPTSTKNDETKKAQAVELLTELFADPTTVIPSKEIYALGAKKDISERTMKKAKKLVPGLKVIKTVEGWKWKIVKDERRKECNLEPLDLPIEI